MLDKIHEILKNTYSLTPEEIELEDNLWHNRILQCWRIDTESEPTESEAEAKRKQKEYQHEYYITHRKKSTKVLIMSDTAIKNRATMTKLRNRICLYEGEEVKYGTLMARMHNKLGYSWPEAKKIADEHLLK
jgi:hypothetical protein